MQKPVLTEKTVRQFVATVGDSHHALTGAVIAAAAAQVVALAEACMQISLENQVDTLNWQETTARIEAMVYLKKNLLDWCEQDAQALGQPQAATDLQTILKNNPFLYDSPIEICRMCLRGAELVQEFRPNALDLVRDDLEMSLGLLTANARAALLLLDSNLRHYTDAAYSQKYEPILTELAQRLGQLTPVERIRP